MSVQGDFQGQHLISRMIEDLAHMNYKAGDKRTGLVLCVRDEEEG